MKIIEPKEYTQFSSEIKSDFEIDGFASMKNVIPSLLIENFKDEISTIFSFIKEGENKDDIFDIINEINQYDQTKLYHLNLNINLMSSWLPIITYLKNFNELIFGASPILNIGNYLLFGLPKDDRLVYDFHQESNYMPGFGIRLLNYHFAFFTKSDAENGAMSILKGSHKNGNSSYRKSKAAQNGYTNLIPHEIEKIQNNHEECQLFVEPGDLIIFHHDLIHKSNFNKTEKTRFTGVVRLLSMNQIYDKLSFSPADY